MFTSDRPVLLNSVYLNVFLPFWNYVQAIDTKALCLKADVKIFTSYL